MRMETAGMSEARTRTLYDVLGVEPDAPTEKIRAIYRLRSRDTHPRRPGVGDGRLQRQLNEAYAILADPERRAEYNAQTGIRVTPRALRPGQPLYAEVHVGDGVRSRGGAVEATVTRWEPCPRCWGEGCRRCEGRGRRLETRTVTVRVPPGADEVLVEGEGMVGDPGGERGDLILYVIEG
jgi:DnaJ-class molecular chaperone